MTVVRKLAVPLLALWLAAATQPAEAAETGKPGPAWRDWSPALFEEAKETGRFVLLELNAVWCHWCHVMEDVTYTDETVLGLIDEHYIPVKVDQDAHPDLSKRYENWGWPAIIVFNGDGEELYRGRGYHDPETFIATLRVIVEEPDPIRPFLLTADSIRAAGIAPDQRDAMNRRFAFAYDYPTGGWGRGHKFLHADPLRTALALANLGDQMAELMARQTFDNAKALIDPVWGGIYQYSDRNRWDSPHYEKIGQSQAEAMMLYAAAHRQMPDRGYLEAARAVARYVQHHLTGPDGGFFTSQDADPGEGLTGKDFYPLDEAGRLALPQPRIDRNVYSNINGLLISGLAAVADAGAPDALEPAIAAARSMLETRRTQDGTFAHGEDDQAGPYLADTLFMGLAFLDLYRSTADRAWLGHATRAADAMLATFVAAGGGLANSPQQLGAGVLAEPFRHLDDNVAAVRFLNELRHHTGDARYGAAAEDLFRYLVNTPPLERLGTFWPGLLLAERELAGWPLHVTVVGAKDDPAAARLFAAALALPGVYRRVEWWDQAEGSLPNHAVSYPETDQATAFACGDGICSLPALEPSELPERVASMRAAAGTP